MIWPATKSVFRKDVRMDLFPASPVLETADGGIFWALTQDVTLEGVDQRQRLADAVAVAGVGAAAENRRRAVVLVLGPDAEDTSRFSPATVRAFLRALNVPLYVWTVATETPEPIPRAWCCAEGGAQITSLLDLRRAVRQLAKDLERQRILWVGGRLLPQELAVVKGKSVGPVID